MTKCHKNKCHCKKNGEFDHLCANSIQTCKLQAGEICAHSADIDSLEAENATITNLKVTNSTDFPNAPTLITVNPALPEDTVAVVPNFQTIQAALDWLQNKKIVNTTIQISNGTYAESLIVGPALVGDMRDLKIQGDLRDIAGCGINAGSIWNPGSGAVPVGGSPTRSGEAQFVGTAGTNIFQVIGILGANSPNFAAAGVDSTDSVLIRHNNGTFQEYGIQSAVGNTLTLDSNLLADANDLGAAMCIVPRVRIVPQPNSNGIVQKTAATFIGLFIQTSGTGAGMSLLGNSQTLLDNVLLLSELLPCIISAFAFGVTTQQVSLYTFLRNFGFTAFNSALLGGFGVVDVIGIGNNFTLVNPLLAAQAGSRALNINLGSRVETVDARFIGQIRTSEGKISHDAGSIDIIVHSGIAVDLRDRSSLVQFQAANGLRIRGAVTPAAVGPTVGVDLRASDFVMATYTPPNTTGAYSFSSVNPVAIALRLGAEPLNSTASPNSTAVLSLARATPSSTVAFNVPNSPGPLIQVLNASTLTVRSVDGTFTLNGAANFLLVDNASTVVWNAGSLNPTFVLPAVESTGIMFNIVRNSSVVVAAGAARTFSGFDRFFNVNKNSNLAVENTTTSSLLPTTVDHYRVDNFSHVVADNSAAVNDAAFVDNVTNGSGFRKINSASIFADPDTTSIVI